MLVQIAAVQVGLQTCSGGQKHADDKFLCLVQQCSKPAQHLILQLGCHTVPLYQPKQERDQGEINWCVLEKV